MRLSRPLLTGAALALISIALLAPHTLRAQVVRGTVVAKESDAPVPSAIVALLDAHGKRVAATLSDQQGRFAVQAPSPGSYSLRVQRVGHASFTSDAFALTAGQTLEQRLAVSAVQLLLPVTIAGDNRCVVRPEDGTQAALLWSEARKALDATQIASDERILRLTLRHYERDRAIGDGTVRNARDSVSQGVSEDPFVSAPAADLAKKGYVRSDGDSITYFAPDARVLLSDEFANDHCLHMRAADSAHAGLIGLAFEPTRKRTLPDVEGTLWLDPHTAELHLFDFHFTSLPSNAHPELAGGRVEFQRLPTSAWIVSRWELDMPLLAERQRQLIETKNAMSGVNGLPPTLNAVAVREAGGEVMEAFTLDGRKLIGEATAMISGSFYDSVSHAPLSNARITLVGTSWSATTDSTGHFALPDVRKGTYTITVSHPAIDALGLAPRQELRLAAGAHVTYDIALPSAATLLDQYCGASRQPGSGLLVGSIIDAKTNRAMADARILLSWSALSVQGKRVRHTTQSITVAADSSGGWNICNVPPGKEYSLRATDQGWYSGIALARLDSNGVVVHELAIDTTVAPSSTPVAATLVAETPDTSATGGPDAAVDAGTAALAGYQRFLARSKRKYGHFLTEDQIQKKQALLVSQLLRSIPGVRVLQMRGRFGSSGYRVTMARSSDATTGAMLAAGNSGQGTAAAFQSQAPQPVGDPVNDPSSPSAQSGRCDPAFYVDGVLRTVLDGQIDNEIRAVDVVGLEVYPPTGPAPEPYSTNQTRCGVIGIWTVRSK